MFVGSPHCTFLSLYCIDSTQVEGEGSFQMAHGAVSAAETSWIAPDMPVMLGSNLDSESLRQKSLLQQSLLKQGHLQQQQHQHQHQHQHQQQQQSTYGALLDGSIPQAHQAAATSAGSSVPITAHIPPAQGGQEHPTISGSSTGKEFYILPHISATEIYDNKDRLPPVPPPGHVYQWELAGIRMSDGTIKTIGNSDAAKIANLAGRPLPPTPPVSSSPSKPTTMAGRTLPPTPPRREQQQHSHQAPLPIPANDKVVVKEPVPPPGGPFKPAPSPQHNNDEDDKRNNGTSTGRAVPPLPSSYRRLMRGQEEDSADAVSLTMQDLDFGGVTLTQPSHEVIGTRGGGGAIRGWGDDWLKDGVGSQFSPSSTAGRMLAGVRAYSHHHSSTSADLDAATRGEYMQHVYASLPAQRIGHHGGFSRYSPGAGRATGGAADLSRASNPSSSPPAPGPPPSLGGGGGGGKEGGSLLGGRWGDDRIGRVQVIVP